MKSRIFPAVLVAGSLLLVGAAPGMAGGFRWTYSGATGPEQWPAQFPDCGGAAQSPVGLTSAALSGAVLSRPKVHNVKDASEVVNNGHSIEAEAPQGTTIKLGGVTYPLLQIHYHRPSEHTVNGFHYPVEVHFVGKSSGGQVAVLGVFLATGKSRNKAWQPYIAAARGLQVDAATGEAMINYAKLLPTGSVGFRYEGSLTTPPCTEGVHWNVSATPVKISKAQMAILESVPFAQALGGGTNRPLQDLNTRTILGNIRVDNGSD